MQVDKEDLLYILMIPLIVMFLMGFYLFIGIVMLVVFGIGGVMWLWNGINYLTPYEPMTPSEKKYWKRVFRLDGIGKKK